MKEIARQCFASLNTDRFGYYILIDGYFEAKLPACNDEEAKEMFKEWLQSKNKQKGNIIMKDTCSVRKHHEEQRKFDKKVRKAVRKMYRKANDPEWVQDTVDGFYVSFPRFKKRTYGN